MEKNTLHVYILFTHEFVTSLLSGSFHFPFFVFLVKVTKNEKNQLSYLFIFCEKITFCLKITADFFGHFDQKPKNGMNPTHVDFNLKQEFLIDYYIVPSPSTALFSVE